MKLTNKDKDLLIKRGYRNDDLTEIENSRFRFEMFWGTNAIQITQKQALKLLGREDFISGIARATFHSTSVRNIKDFGDDSGVYFKKIK
jgi:hypothetical protein